MNSEIERASSALFPFGGSNEFVNVGFFLGHSRVVTGEQLAEQLNRADAQIRSGMAKRTTGLDGHLTTRCWQPAPLQTGEEVK